MQRKHINALSRAVREAKSSPPFAAWTSSDERAEWDKFIKTAEEGLRFVRREFARQKGMK